MRPTDRLGTSSWTSGGVWSEPEAGVAGVDVVFVFVPFFAAQAKGKAHARRSVLYMVDIDWCRGLARVSQR